MEYGKKTEYHGKLETSSDDLKNDEITEKLEKMRKHTLGREIWRGKLKKAENLEMSTVGHVIWQEN